MYDAIVIGARCAGAATAMLLARSGRDVLLVDRAKFGSDIPHGHFLHRHGPRRLRDWGLLDRVLASGCPRVTRFTSDMGDFPLTGTELEVDGIPMGVGPRRSALQAFLPQWREAIAAIPSSTRMRWAIDVDPAAF